MLNSSTSCRSHRSLALLFGLSLWLTAFAASGQSGPYANTLPVTYTNPAVANLNGFASPNGLPTVAWFEWGANGSYENVSESLDVGDGGATLHVETTVSNFVAGAVYQFRLVASNSLGTAVGSPKLFCSYGHTVGWGLDDASQLGFYPDWNLDVTVAGGYQHSLALNRNGELAIRGRFSGGGTAFVPEGLSNVLHIASGENHCLAVTKDGAVIAWKGAGTHYGETNVPPGLSNVVSVAAGDHHSVALTSDGMVFAWGDSFAGISVVPSGLSNIVAISAGYRHTLALRANGAIVGWGFNMGGVLSLPAGLTNVIAVAAGRSHSMALKADGTVVQWGTLAEPVPTGLSNVVDIAAGFAHSLALKADGTVIAWGNNGFGEVSVPTNLPPVLAIGAGQQFSLAITAQPAPPRAAVPWATHITSTSARLEGFATPNSFESTAWFEWGLRGSGFTGATPPVGMGNGVGVAYFTADLSGLSKGAVYHCRAVVSNEIGVVYSHAHAFTTGQRVTAWGRNDNGQTDVPAGLSNIVQIAAGDYHTLALKSDGEVIGWGRNNYGQTTLPPEATNVIALAAGEDHTLALRGDGTVVAWGNDAYGKATVPAGLSNVVAIVAKGLCSLALRSDGTVVDWGRSFSPIWNTAAREYNMVAIAASRDRVFAIREDGAYASWNGLFGVGYFYLPFTRDYTALAGNPTSHIGLRRNGQIATTDVFNPVPSTLTNAIALASGSFYPTYYALDQSGDVTAWGSQNDGASDVPPGLANAVAITAGFSSAYALGANVPYIINAGSVSGYVNRDIVIRLPARDPNGDPLTFRIATLPGAGSLYQYDAGLRGAAIITPDSLIDDALGHVIFAPDTNAFGSPYATFDFLVNDGLADSPPATVTVNVVLPPAPQINAATSGWNTNVSGLFQLNFTGDASATYSAYGSTNLLEWEWLGYAESPSAGVFQFIDINSTNLPQRFYKAGAP